MYSSLLLSHNGGLSPNCQQIERDRNAYHIIIGLGGAGVDCIRRIKSEVFATLKPDDAENSAPTYSNIHLLGIDSDNISFNYDQGSKYPPLDDSETFSTVVPNLGVLIPAVHLNRPEYSWLNSNLSASQLSLGYGGASGIRQIGRLLFFNRVSLFVAKLDQMLHAAQGRNVHVYVASSLCGGTGSGCFLDVCYLIRMALSHAGITGLVHGLFFMPEVVISKVPRSSASLVDALMSNGYAALQELNYCMSFPQNGGSFSQRYTNEILAQWDKSPVDICYLIDATCTDGRIVENPYRNAMDTVSDYVMNVLVNGSPWVWHFAGLAHHIMQNQNSSYGANPFYATIGSCTLKIPLKEISTYLATKMFHHMSSWKNIMPSDEQYDAFTRENGLDFNAIRRELVKDCDTSFLMPEQLMQAAWKDDNAVEKYLNDCMFAAMEQMKSNYTKMCSGKDLAGKQPGHLAAKVFYALTEIAADPERGAFFASSLLHSVSGIGLIDRIESYIHAAYEVLMTSRSCYEWKIKDLKESKRALHESNGLNRRSRSASYCVAEQQLFHCEFQINLYETLTTLLEEFRCQLVDISKGFFDILQRTINGLIDTFEENQQLLEWNDLAQRSSNGTNIIEISDVQKKLDAYLNNINWSGKLQQFMLELLKHSEVWINQKEDVIAKFVTDFCSRTFDNCVDVGLDRYLRDKYQTVAGPILVNCIDHNEIERTISASSPLFDFNALQVNRADLTYLFVPIRSKLAQHAAAVRQQASFKDDGAYTTWLSEMAGRSVIETDVTVTSSDKVLTLSTCTPGGASRFIVMGKLAAVND